LHQAILCAFATTGCPPNSEELDRAAATCAVPVQEMLTSLYAADIVRLGPDGQIQVAYPQPADPAPGLPSSGIEVFAMCAIVALGVPPVVGSEAVITTSDPSSGTPITVTAVAG